jgi:hypothetical protein
VSHVAVRMLADRLADADEGVNAISAFVPRFTGDEVPPEVTIYDATRTGWVARGKVPKGEDGDEEQISFPCVVVFLQQGNYESGVARDASGGRYTQGVVTLIAQLIMHEADTELAASHGMYLLRAIRGVVLRYGDPEATTNTQRTECGTMLMPVTATSIGGVNAFNEDHVVSPGAVFVTQPILETAPVT